MKVANRLSPWLWGPLAALALAAGVASAADAAEGQPAEKPTAARMTIDYGDGVEKTFTQIPWREGQTVWNLLEAASKHPRGIRIEKRGSGSTTLIVEIDGLRNEGAGGDSRNWLFTVNSKMADVGCGACAVRAGDHVVWRFATYEPK